jgi:hypothetical protein
VALVCVGWGLLRDVICGMTKNGTDSATIRIAAKIKPNTYGVTGRIGNHYLPVAALQVRG